MRSRSVSYARWAVGASLVLGFASILRYPGGDPFHRSSHGYAPTLNFLSDLGMTVAYNGEPNRLGAGFFVASLLVLVGSVGTMLAGLVGNYSNTPRSRSFARSAGMVGALACAAFVVVAFTPENRVMALHVRATLLAWRLVPVVSCLLAIAAFHADGVPVRSAFVLCALTAVLVAYVVLLGWGPSTASLSGLQIDVIAQKIVALVLVSALMLVSIDGRPRVHG